MPCSDSSSSILIKLDHAENFSGFQFAKITCGREITAETGLAQYLKGKPLCEILEIPFETIQNDLPVKEDETRFILYLEWDALRSAIAQYLGSEHASIDVDRCRITSIDYTDEGIEVAEVILPPKELPKILPCSLGKG
jgi:hypothetical protein